MCAEWVGSAFKLRATCQNVPTRTLATGPSSAPARGPPLCAPVPLGVGSGSETPCDRRTCSSGKAGLRNSCPFPCAIQGGAAPRTRGALTAVGGAQPLPGALRSAAVGSEVLCPSIPLGRASFLSPLWHSEMYSSMLCNFGPSRSLFKARVSG